MSNVYWIGGSSCSGKSTCAEILSKKHGIELLQTDHYCFGKYMFDNNEIDAFKAIKKYRDMIMAGIDAFATTDALVSYNAFIEYCTEAFQLLKVDIEEKSKNQALIVEGAHILPELIKNHSNAENCIFLISSKEQQRSIWKKEMNMEIPGGHPGEIESFKTATNKKLVEETRIEFHDKIAKHIQNSSGIFNTQCIYLNNDKNIEELVFLIEQKFGMASGKDLHAGKK